MAQIQWYPGHMAKAKREISEKMPLVDIVFEIVDARMPLSSQNPIIPEIIKNKPVLVLLNKANLADKKVTKAWIEYFKSQGMYALDIDVVDNYNVNKINDYAREILKDKFEKKASKGIVLERIRALVIGIPNVGKSTFINTVAKRKAAQVGNKPGVTKSQTWIRVSDTLELLDTPGILWPKFESEIVGKNLALGGSIKDEILPLDEIVSYGLMLMKEHYPELLANRYGIEIRDDMELLDIYDAIGKRRNCLIRGGEIDYDRVTNLVLYDIRNNKLGEMSYERPDDSR